VQHWLLAATNLDLVGAVCWGQMSQLATVLLTSNMFAAAAAAAGLQ
jgi:hypothetical protein